MVGESMVEEHSPVYISARFLLSAWPDYFLYSTGLRRIGVCIEHPTENIYCTVYCCEMIVFIVKVK